MARKVNRLNARAIGSLTGPGKYADGNGLYLVVGKDGARGWTLFFQWEGARKEMGLGSAKLPGGVKLAEARMAAEAARRLVKEGVNPIEERRQRKAEKRAEAARALLFARQAAPGARSALQRLWRSVKAYDARMNDPNQPGGPRPPTGDDYSELFDLVKRAALAELNNRS